MHRGGDEFYERPSETEVEKGQILGDCPSEPKQPEAHGTEVQRRHWHDEKGEREWNRESQKIEERVVADAGARRGQSIGSSE